MNELVNSDRGILISSVKERQMRLGRCFDVDEASIERAVGRLLGMTMPERRRKGEEARSWFVENDLMFRGQLLGLLKDCAGKRAVKPQVTGHWRQNWVRRHAVRTSNF
jgi:hypothetical protein